MHFSSYFTSLLLHGLVVLAVAFWPSSPPVRLDQPMLQISMNLGAPGGDMIASPVLGHQKPAVPTQAVNKPAPPKAADAIPVPKPDAVQVAEAPRPKASSQPAPRPEAIPLPEKKTPPPDPEKVREPEKPAEQPKKKTQPEPAPKKKTPSPEDALKAALADARKQTARPEGKASVASALKDLKQSETSGGGGGEGRGAGGGGLYDVYLGQVIMAIRPNWSMAVYSRQNLVTEVWIRIASSGDILDCRIERGSGRAEFDGSALNAVRRTRRLPPPPTPQQQEIIVVFNSQDAP